MTDVIVFHHVHGLTVGVRHFAEELEAAGHHVTLPDLYEGRTFADREQGLAHAQAIGFDTIMERGRRAAEGLPRGFISAGFSLGVLPAQLVAQTRPGVKGALFFHACAPVAEFGGHWPADVPVQIHAMEADAWFVDEDLEAARDLVRTAEDAELFLYQGDGHLFADTSLPDYDEDAAGLLTERTFAFLERWT